jgi:hypothetical protein
MTANDTRTRADDLRTVAELDALSTLLRVVSWSMYRTTA